MQSFLEAANLDSILVQIGIDLAHGALSAKRSFHTPVLASQGADGPDARTVVLREADLESRRLLCHSDIRSPKITSLRDNPAVTWLFYDRAINTQLRIRGEVRVSHNDDLARARWKASATRSRACYHAALAPGATTPTPVPPEPLGSGFANFAVIDCTMSSIDWLFLQHAGHLRARFDWKDHRWEGAWVAP